MTLTSRVAEFSDLEQMERELAHGDAAAVLTEPALTNIGIVLPEPGYLAGVRELTRRHGTLLINDETHTFSAGPGGCTAAWDLKPDLLTIGEAIGGGTLADNALSVAATRATREHVLTDDAFARMAKLSERFEASVQAGIDAHGLPWSVGRLGARSEYRFASPAPHGHRVRRGRRPRAGGLHPPLLRQPGASC